MDENEDEKLARMLQSQFDQEANSEMAPFLPPSYRTPQKSSKLSVVSNDWETIDPTPDLHALFIQFNETFFWGQLLSCEVRWSPRMTTCAGICRYSPRERFCTIGISIPLLKLRPRKDLVETLLHEMIHAYLFVTDNNDNHDGHGPEFHKHMYRINQATGANISVYHTFHDEVALYKQHWWRCGGPCTKRPPFYGFVKRAMNRAPGPSDRWWSQHENTCGGNYTKVKEPEGYGKKGKENKKVSSSAVSAGGQRDIRTMFGSSSSAQSTPVENTKPRKKPNSVPKPNSVSKPNSGTNGNGSSPTKRGGGGRGNIFGFGGSSFKSPGGAGGGLKTAGKSGTFVVKPGWKTKDNSSTGTVLNSVPESEPSVPQSAQSFHGAGFTLSGAEQSTSGSQKNLSAREMARLRWANSFPAQTLSPTTDLNSRIVKLPPITSDGSNRLSNPGHSGITVSEPATGVNSKPGSSSTAECPVCGAVVAEETMNSHLDQCLVSEENQKEKEDDLFDEDEDALLMSVAEHSVVRIPDSDEDDDKPLVDLNDSDDDDEPLIKKRNGETNSSLEQDENDLLFSLEDRAEDKEGEFACPVCQKLIRNTEMNSHLDICLS